MTVALGQTYTPVRLCEKESDFGPTLFSAPLCSLKFVGQEVQFAASF